MANVAFCEWAVKTDFERTQDRQKIDPAGFIRRPHRQIFQIERPVDPGKAVVDGKPFQAGHVRNEVAHGQSRCFGIFVVERFHIPESLERKSG